MILDIQENKQKKRFETTRDGHTAFVDYVIHGETYELTHTEVPAEIQDKGIGTQLVMRVLDMIKEKRQPVKPTCPFVADIIEDNDEYKSLVE